MLVANPIKRNKFGEQNPPSLSNLPTFTPNEEYIYLLGSLHKELHRESQIIDHDKVKRLRRQLIKIELTLSSQEIICNTRLAIKDSPQPNKKSKYKL